MNESTEKKQKEPDPLLEAFVGTSDDSKFKIEEDRDSSMESADRKASSVNGKKRKSKKQVLIEREVDIDQVFLTVDAMDQMK